MVRQTGLARGIVAMAFLKLGMVAAAAAVTVAAVPASAVVTTFATFSPISSVRNFRFGNTGGGPTRPNDANYYSIATGGARDPGSVDVRFSFLVPQLDEVQNVRAVFTLGGSVDRGSRTTGTTSFTQSGLGGAFSFVSAEAFTINGRSFAAGANLLSGSFSGGELTGQFGGSSGGINASTGGGDTVTFTSDFLNFSNTVSRDLGITLTAVTPNFRPGSNGVLNSFRASAGGQFSSDPAPLINAVPEPGTWAMLIAGFGLVGATARRRRTTTVAA